MRWLLWGLVVVLTGCSSESVASTPSPSVAPAPTIALATPAPTSYDFRATISAPKCLGGYDLINANVVIRNERDEVIGSAVTEYIGEPALVAYERAVADDGRGAFETLWDYLNERGTIQGSGGRNGSAIRLNAAFYISPNGSAASRSQALQQALDSGVDGRLWDVAVAGAERAARTGQPEVREQRALREIFETDDLACYVSFTTKVSPATFYQMKVGNHPAPTYRFEELAAQEFTVNLALGR